MRYYLVTIQYNKEKEAENRTVPKAFDDVESAIAEFHTQMGKDMKNDTLGWALSIVFDSNGGIIRDEKWVANVVEPEPEVVEE